MLIYFNYALLVYNLLNVFESTKVLDLCKLCILHGSGGFETINGHKVFLDLKCL